MFHPLSWIVPERPARDIRLLLPFRDEPNNEKMKNQLTALLGVLGLALIGLLASSCADMGDGNTHQMGPPGKETPMADSAMPSKAR